jgi:hypothetical protein
MLKAAIFKKGIQTVLNWIYPPQCLACGEVCDSGSLLCIYCGESVQVNDPSMRCPDCFSSHACRVHDKNINKIAFTLDSSIGVMGILRTRFSQVNGYYLDQVLGAIMYAYLKSVLRWPNPDMVVSLPVSNFKSAFLRYDPQYLLAKQLSKYFQIKCLDPFFYKGGLVPWYKNKYVWSNKKILVIGMDSSYNSYIEAIKQLRYFGTKANYALGLFDPVDKSVTKRSAP